MKRTERFGKIIYVGIINKYYAGYQHGYLVLKDLADKLIPFDYRMINLQHGREEMNRMFLDLIKKEKPNFVFIYSIVDDFDVDTFLKIREVSPKTRSLMFSGDDDCMYESSSRFYKLLFDNIIIFQKDYLHLYKEEKNIRVEFALATNFDCYHPMNVEKKYNVSFFGIPECDRIEYIKYLIDNGIDVNIFGRNWDNYPEFKKYYGGILPFEEFIKKMNESKITLNFSKNRFHKLHFKGRVFETAMCRTFMLVEYCPTYGEMLNEGKEIVMFKDKEELLKQVKYYLDNEKEREDIAKRAYKRVSKGYGFYYDLKKFLKKYYKKTPIHNSLPKIDKKIFEITEKEINLPIEELKENLKGYDYVCFNKNILMKNNHKEYFQIYALEKSKKDMCCCSCYLSKKNIGIYFYYNSFEVFSRNKEHFVKMLDISTLAAKKDYFLNNLDNFRKLFKNNKIDFFTEENTTFIQMPLIDIPKIDYVTYKDMKAYFLPKFLYRLYNLREQGKLFTDPYIYNLFFEMIKGNFYLMYLLLNAVKDPYYKAKIDEIKCQEEIE